MHAAYIRETGGSRPSPPTTKERIKMRIIMHTPRGVFESKEYNEPEEKRAIMDALNNSLADGENLVFFEIELPDSECSLVFSQKMFEETIFEVIR